MINLFQQDLQTLDRQSSKGMQLKWKNKDIWYKADYVGYAGFVEYLVSHLLTFSNLDNNEFVKYNTTQIKYKETIFLGCKSNHFIPDGWQLITLERLFQNYYGEGLNKSIYSIQGYEERITYLVEQTIRITNLKDFGKYMDILLTIDAFFLNEDRHTHNIAVLIDEKGDYHYCPIFDNGACLLADTKLDYPLHVPVLTLIDEVKPKTLAQNFDEQLDAVENVYGQHIKFTFTKKDVLDLINKEKFYDEKIKERVLTLIFNQMHKYQYLFTSK